MLVLSGGGDFIINSINILKTTQNPLKGTCSAGQFLIYWRSMRKNIILKILQRSHK